MRPVSSTILVVLLAAVCGLCVVQWSREADLRQLSIELREELTRIAGSNQELESRAKAADAEILRLTGALGELRTTSVSKEEVEEQKLLNTQMRELVEKQNLAVQQQNEAIEKQNAAIQQANEIIKKLTEERDAVTKKLNETTALYNKLLAQAPKPAPAS